MRQISSSLGLANTFRRRSFFRRSIFPRRCQARRFRLSRHQSCFRSRRRGWDYVYVDSDARRVTSLTLHVVVMNADTSLSKATFLTRQASTASPWPPTSAAGFTSNGRANTVTIFDLKTLKTIAPQD